MFTSNDYGKTYLFSTYSGRIYNRYLLKTILDPQTVRELGFDAPGEHYKNYQFLPVGSPASWDKYNYARLQAPDGSLTYVGLPWIQPDSLQVVEDNVRIVRIYDATVDSIESLRRMLVASGHEKFDIT